MSDLYLLGKANAALKDELAFLQDRVRSLTDEVAYLTRTPDSETHKIAANFDNFHTWVKTIAKALSEKIKGPQPSWKYMWDDIYELNYAVDCYER